VPILFHYAELDAHIAASAAALARGRTLQWLSEKLA
jgi:hypothetical protein